MGVEETLRILIVDDEPPARDRIAELLKAEKGLKVVGECSSGSEAIESIQRINPDIVFLDIQMPDIDGFDVLAKLEPEELPIIIFVTAYEKYALKAFEVNAVDYLLKPFKDERFHSIVDKAKSEAAKSSINSLARKVDGLLESYEDLAAGKTRETRQDDSKKFQNRFVVKSVGKISFVRVEDVDWIGAEGPYVSLHTRSETHLVRESLKNLESKLDPEKFIRIHRSTIVNSLRIKELLPYSHGDYIVVLTNGTRLKFSRRYRKHLDNLLDETA